MNHLGHKFEKKASGDLIRVRFFSLYVLDINILNMKRLVTKVQKLKLKILIK